MVNASNRAAARSPGRPRASDGLDSREVLLGAGLDLFAARGFANVAVSEIASAAGVSIPVIYQRFGNKAELFVAVAELVYDRGLGHLHASLEGAVTFDESLDAVLRGFADLHRSDRRIMEMVLTVLVEADRDETLATRLQPTLQRFRAFFDDIAELAPPEIAADAAARRDLSRALVTLCSGMTASAVTVHRPADYRRMVDAMRQLLRLN